MADEFATPTFVLSYELGNPVEERLIREEAARLEKSGYKAVVVPKGTQMSGAVVSFDVVLVERLAKLESLAAEAIRRANEVAMDFGEVHHDCGEVFKIYRMINPILKAADKVAAFLNACPEFERRLTALEAKGPRKVSGE